MENNIPKGIRTWIEVDRRALKDNYTVFRNIISPKCKLMAIAKSNAYGHDLIEYAKEMEKLGADFIGVDSITEALALRRSQIQTPILVLGYTLPEMYDIATKNNISLTISSPEQFEILKRFSDSNNEIINIHIKIDTGMHRQGFYFDELKDVIGQVKKSKNIKVEGIYTHFASAKNPALPEITNKQIVEFQKACDLFSEANLNPIRHAAATSSTIIFPETHFDMVRIGIGLMGLWPSAEVKAKYEDKIKLSPALSWKTIISEVKKVKKGEKVGYGLTELLESDSTLAILPIGYWHGFKRSLSNIGQVLVNGKRAKVCGKVSMDMVTIDVTKINDVKIGDVVTLLGCDLQESISADDMAKLADSYNYEIITTLNPLIKRFYL